VILEGLSAFFIDGLRVLWQAPANLQYEPTFDPAHRDRATSIEKRSLELPREVVRDDRGSRQKQGQKQRVALLIVMRYAASVF
jgi:hypothetical protein